MVNELRLIRANIRREITKIANAPLRCSMERGFIDFWIDYGTLQQFGPENRAPVGRPRSIISAGFNKNRRWVRGGGRKLL